MHDLYSTTMGMLKVTAIPIKAISADTGLGYNWLKRLARGDFNDPGVRKIQCLHDYLARSAENNTRSSAG